MAIFETKFSHGDMVYLVSDPDQTPWLVNEIRILPKGLFCYSVSQGSRTTEVYEIEVQEEPNPLMKFN